MKRLSEFCKDMVIKNKNGVIIQRCISLITLQALAKLWIKELEKECDLLEIKIKDLRSNRRNSKNTISNYWNEIEKKVSIIIWIKKTILEKE